MAKIFSLDLGTNSIGFANRNTDSSDNLKNQLEQFGSVIFKKGVGNGKTGEFSYAAERTKHRSSRRLYQARKYRIWETLKVLIEYGYCPLSIEELDKWRKYDKSKGLKRQYPINAIKFEQWVRLDFDSDGKPDYSSPYELRAELAITQLDFSIEINRFKLGRALYHIAQRRGFKSSKGETLKEQENATKETLENTEITASEVISLKKSEEKKAKDLFEYQRDKYLPTIGCAFYQLEKEGIRIRGSIYQAVRSQYRDEVKYIFDLQNQLDTNSDFFKRIYSDKKDGSIFYKRPLRSQKGLIGKCTLETSKYRCPISHPEFEKFRAFAFINNIQYRTSPYADWQNLSADQKLGLYNEKFLLTRANFKFQDIREWIQKDIQKLLLWSEDKRERTINYKDKTNVSGCPISGRLKNLLGIDWENFAYETTKKYTNRITKEGKEYAVEYKTEDIWHICFSYDDEESIVEFAKTQLNLDDKKTKSLINLWIAIPQGYSMLSLKAIRNINRFLIPNVNKEGYNGLIYTDAALLAKIPEILGEKLWAENEFLFFNSINKLAQQNREEKCILTIANTLIANYKALEYEEQFAYKNTTYQLDDSDLREIKKYTVEALGGKTWETTENKDEILNTVGEKYQQFFSSSKRDYYKLPKLGDTIKQFMLGNFDFLDEKKLNKLYHPSMVEFYKPVKETQIKHNGILLSKRLLESPVIGAFKNPMAMRTLHSLRKLVNTFLLEGKIDEDTRIVVETARDLNNANMRWAIKAYQENREAENKKIKEAIKELRGEERDAGDIDKARLLIEQNRDYMFDKSRYDAEKEHEDDSKKNKKISGKTKDFEYKKDVTKYKLWLEQGMKCLYTGNIISISNLFDENSTDFEHTIPRSISFDNSMANLTVCDAYYNRHVKKNQIPTQLPNYDKDYTAANGNIYSAIKPRLQTWKEKVEQLKNNVEFWKQKSKQAQTKDVKDSAIRQRHLWQMELNYWQNKLDRFTMTEVTSGFKNSQLNDTRLITKYAYHYLKSVFNKVEVQKGSITSDFRKILGVQSVDEKKDRDKHSHHAIDAAILSCIPIAARRDRMLELFYKVQENKRLNLPTDFEERELEKEKQNCLIGDISNLNQYIEENILINHVSKDQTLTPSKRKARKRGKEIFIKNENGEQITKWIQGDCIRGQLHGDTFYGAITQAEKDDRGNLKRNEDGTIIRGEQIFYVIRRDLKYKKSAIDKGFKDLEDLQNQVVDKNIGKMIAKQCEGKTFKDACEEGFYMFDRKGNKVNRIRHIRCFTSIKNPLSIKKQTYKSNKDYKQNYYAEVGDLYIMCRYINKKSQSKLYQIYSLFDISENRKMQLEDIPKTIIDKNNNEYEFDIKLHIGDKVLIYDKNKDEIIGISEPCKLSKRLYIVRSFENPSRINLVQHICSKKDGDLGKGENIKDYNNLPEKIRCSVNTINFLIEGKDFEMNLDGTIIYK